MVGRISSKRHFCIFKLGYYFSFISLLQPIHRTKTMTKIHEEADLYCQYLGSASDELRWMVSGTKPLPRLNNVLLTGGRTKKPEFLPSTVRALVCALMLQRHFCLGRRSDKTASRLPPNTEGTRSLLPGDAPWWFQVFSCVEFMRLEKTTSEGWQMSSWSSFLD